MVDPTLDPFLTKSYFPLKLPSRLISVYSQNWTRFLFHVVKSCCALWTAYPPCNIIYSLFCLKTFVRVRDHCYGCFLFIVLRQLWILHRRWALWTGGAWRLFKRLLKSAHLRRRTFKLSVARLPKTTHFLVVTRLVSHWPTNSTRFVKKLLNA